MSAATRNRSPNGLKSWESPNHQASDRRVIASSTIWSLRTKQRQKVKENHTHSREAEGRETREKKRYRREKSSSKASSDRRLRSFCISHLTIFGSPPGAGERRRKQPMKGGGVLSRFRDLWLWHEPRPPPALVFVRKIAGSGCSSLSVCHAARATHLPSRSIPLCSTSFSVGDRFKSKKVTNPRRNIA